MFRIEFFVDDKKLGPALVALVGIAHGQPSVMPVVNVKKKGNGLVAKTEGSSLERFAEALVPRKGEHLRARDIRAMMKPIGMREASTGYMLKNAVKNGLLKKNGRGKGTMTTYRVA